MTQVKHPGMMLDIMVAVLGRGGSRSTGEGWPASGMCKSCTGGPLQCGHSTVSSSQLTSERESSLRGVSVMFSQNAVCTGVGANKSIMWLICAA